MVAPSTRAASRARPSSPPAPLREPYAGLWLARRGEYRVRCRIDEDPATVVVLDVSHRRDAHRR